MMRMLIVYAPIFLAHLHRHAKHSALVMMVGKKHEHEQHHSAQCRQIFAYG